MTCSKCHSHLPSIQQHVTQLRLPSNAQVQGLMLKRLAIIMGIWIPLQQGKAYMSVMIQICTCFECQSQEALEHILQPSVSGGDMAAAAADAKEDKRLAAGARLSSEQKEVLVALREVLCTNLGR